MTMSKIFSKQQIDEMRAVIIQEVKFSEIMREITKVDEIGEWFAVQCVFHTTKTTDAGRLRDAHPTTGEEGVYFCNNTNCSIHHNYEKGRISLTHFWKEYHNFENEPMAVLDLYQNRLGRKLPEGKGTPLTPEEKAKLQKEKTMRRLFIHTAYFYHSMLLSPEGKEGLDYIVNERKIPMDYVMKYRLGFTPGRTALKEYLLSQNFTLEDIKASKLLSKKNNDLYYNRVVFPMIDIRQNVLSDKFDFSRAVVYNLYSRFLPKYITEENEFLKHRYTNREFPLFNFAEARRKKVGLMIEGCFDTVAAQVLLDRLVLMENEGKIPEEFIIKPSDIGSFASYGTNGFKEDVHAPQLVRANFETLLIAGDHDANFAGQEANIKRGEMLQGHLKSTNIRIVSWGAKDVNTLLQEDIDPIEFLRFINDAVSLEEYRILVALEKSGNPASVRTQFEALNKIEKLLLDLNLHEENSLLKYMKTLNTVASFTGVDVETILMHIMMVKHKKDLENAASAANVPLKTLLLSELVTASSIFGEGN